MVDQKKPAAKPKPKPQPQDQAVDGASDACQIGVDIATLRREQKQIASKIRGK